MVVVEVMAVVVEVVVTVKMFVVVSRISLFFFLTWKSLHKPKPTSYLFFPNTII